MYIPQTTIYIKGKFFKRYISSAHKFTKYNCHVKTDYKMWRNILEMLKVETRELSQRRNCYLSNVHFRVCITVLRYLKHY